MTENVCLCFFNQSISINESIDLLKKFARKQNMPIMKLLVFIFYDENRANFVQTAKSLLKYPYIVISVECSICYRIEIKEKGGWEHQ